MFSQSNFYESAPIMNLRKTLKLSLFIVIFKAHALKAILQKIEILSIKKEFPTSDMGQISSNISSH